MSNTFRLQTLAAAVAAIACTNAWAIDPQGIDVGGMTFIPTLNVSETYDDNIFETRDNETTSWVTRINPTFELLAETGKTGHRLKYAINQDIFHSAHDADNADHHLTGESVFAFDSRNRLKLAAGYHKIEDTEDTATQGENDKYETTNLGGVYSFGAETARTQLDLGANHFTKRYSNSDGLNSEKEFDSLTLNAIGYYRVAPKTRLLAEVRHTDYDYKSVDLDSENMAYLLGATWEATAKTTGTVKVGYEEKDFDSSRHKNQNSPMWEIGVAWQPRTYSTFTLDARRAFDEGDDGAEVIKSESITAGWKHYWMERLYSNVTYTRSESKYEGQDRKDDKDIFGIGLTYEARRWLDIGVGYRYSENDSSVRSESYERNMYGISFTASL